MSANHVKSLAVVTAIGVLLVISVAVGIGIKVLSIGLLILPGCVGYPVILGLHVFLQVKCLLPSRRLCTQAALMLAAASVLLVPAFLFQFDLDKSENWLGYQKILSTSTAPLRAPVDLDFGSGIAWNLALFLPSLGLSFWALRKSRPSIAGQCAKCLHTLAGASVCPECGRSAPSN